VLVTRLPDPSDDDDDTKPTEEPASMSDRHA
jgi:hypothetical protein